MMEFQRHKNAVEAGVTFGFAAGLVLAVAAIVGASALGLGAAHPLRWTASVLLGEGALYENLPGFALFVFAFSAHAVLTALHGVVFCLAVRSWRRGRDTSLLLMALLGTLFGVWTWFFDLQILGRTAFPWFLEASQLPLVLLHALAFGLPLGLFFGLSERFERRAGVLPAGVHT